MFFHSPNHSITKPLQRVTTHLPNHTKRVSLALGLSLIPLPCNLFARDALLKRYEFSLPRMGTSFRIELYSPDDATASKRLMLPSLAPRNSSRS